MTDKQALAQPLCAEIARFREIVEEARKEDPADGGYVCDLILSKLQTIQEGKWRNKR